MKKINVAVIGGGTGTTAVLSDLKNYNDLDISVVVGMADDGGSNAVIRDEFGLLPLSDLRKSIIALSEVGEGSLRDLFVYRFDKGNGLSGHTLGNLMMMALTEITGTEVGAIEKLRKLFLVKGKVFPVTLGSTHLVAEYENGAKVKGEHLIDEPKLPHELGRITKLSLYPEVASNPAAIKALEEADYIIAGPGDLYTTTLASLVVSGISEAIAENKGKFIFISNLMTKCGQTTGMRASDLVGEIAKYAGRKPDLVIVHEGKLPEDILKKYAEDGESPIEDDLGGGRKVVRANLVNAKEIIREKGDVLKRSLIRHDSVKLAKIIYKIFKDEKCGYKA